MKNFSCLRFVAVSLLCVLTETLLCAQGQPLEQKFEVIEFKDGSNSPTHAFQPGYIYVYPNKPIWINIVSTENPIKVRCKDQFVGLTGNPTDLTQCVTDGKNGRPRQLELQVQDKRIQLEVRPLPVGPRSQVPWFTAVFAMLLAGISWGQWQRALRHADSRNQQNLLSQLPRVQDRINACAQLLAPPVNVKSQTAVSAARKKSVASQNMEKFLAAADGWCRAVNDLPHEVQKQVKEIRNLQLQNRSGDDGLYQKAAATATQVIISCSDRMFDQKFQNETIQQALKIVVSAAGLELLWPREGTPVNHNAHKMVGSTPTNVSQQRGLISRVACRGLVHVQSQSIIAQAEVFVYD